MPYGYGDTESPAYRYSYNGMEKDDEIKNIEGSSYDFGARMYDSRVGRFLSLDVYSKNICWQSGYIYADNSPIYQIDLNGNLGTPNVEVKKNQVLIGGKIWREKWKYDFVVSKTDGGGQWIFAKAKSDMGASTLGAAIILAFAIEEGGWGSGNNQKVTHNQFSLLQQTPNGQVGTEHGYPMEFSSFEKGFTEFHDLLKNSYPEMLNIVKKDVVTADDINKALKSGNFHQRGGYTDSDKGKAILNVLKYAITYTADVLKDEIETTNSEINKVKNQLKNTNFNKTGGVAQRLVLKFKLINLEDKVISKKKELEKLDKVYDNLKEKF